MDDSFSITLAVLRDLRKQIVRCRRGGIAFYGSRKFALARELRDSDASARELSEFDNLLKSAAR
jgi:hypothetical protein